LQQFEFKTSMKKYNLIIVFLFLNLFSLNAQNRREVLNLGRVLELARKQSSDALVAKNQFLTSYWQYRTFKAGLLPQLKLDATLPSFNRSISKITLPDGSEVYQSQKSASFSGDLSLTQKIGITGGEIFMNSTLERLDIYRDSTISSYLSSPFTIGLRQPIFGYNQYRWQRKIEPIRYKEAKQRYLESMEDLSSKAVNMFFDLLYAQIRLRIAEVNQANNDTLYKIAQGRYNLGKIAENELLQLELALLNSNLQVEQSKNDLDINLFKLKSFLGIKETIDFDLILPQKPVNMKVESSDALAYAKNNRSDALSYERKLLEAKSSVNQAKAESRFSANLYALYGLTQSSPELASVYKNAQDRQQLVFGVQIPLVDWGLGKAKVKVAESNQEVIQNQVAQEKTDFEQEVLIKVLQYKMQENQLMIASKADTIGAKRFEVTKARYLIGKIGITDFNIAVSEKDQAKQDYIQALRNYWLKYFEIRRLTLFDFLDQKQLDVNEKELN